MLQRCIDQDSQKKEFLATGLNGYPDLQCLIGFCLPKDLLHHSPHGKPVLKSFSHLCHN